MEMDNPMRIKLTVVLIVAAVAAAATISVIQLRKKETTAAPAAVAEKDAERSPDTSPAQIEQVPRISQDAVMPPATNATGSSPPPK